MPQLTPDFRDFLSLLNSEQIEYLVIGGYAVGHYGYVRYTKDMDVWVAVGPANLDRLRAALQRFGFSPQSLPDPLFQPPRTVLRFGRPPNRIEVLSAISGVEFAECYSRRETVETEGLRISVINREDLIANKRASARPQDIADVDKITKATRRRAP
jgi:predicted nucleotidyltransferase